MTSRRPRWRASVGSRRGAGRGRAVSVCAVAAELGTVVSLFHESVLERRELWREFMEFEPGFCCERSDVRGIDQAGDEITLGIGFDVSVGSGDQIGERG